MNAPAKTTIDALELDDQLNSARPPRVVDVRTPTEFQTAHITGSHNVPLDILRENRSKIVEHLPEDVVLVCKSGQRAAQANELLNGAGVHSGRVLDGGFSDWESRELSVQRGTERWDLERQVRLVAGSIVVSSVAGSVVVPQLKWLAAAIGGGLTYAAISNTCGMAAVLSKLPYNRGANSDVDTIVAQLDGEASSS